MGVLKKYDTVSQQWLPVVVGAAGSTVEVVEHGFDETVARPFYAAVVYWIGGVPPLNAQNADIWYPTPAVGSGSGS